MDKKDLKIVFFGTPEFAVSSLDRLIEEGYDVAGVVTMPDKTGGRGHKVIESDVKKYALQKGLPILQPVKLRDPEFISALQNINADLFIVIAFRMMPEIVWGMPRLGTFNLHASLLPKYRGAAPINWAIINGDKKSGVTTFFLTHSIDTGDIIDQKEIAIPDEWEAGDLHDALMQLGAEMTSETVAQICNGTLHTYPQPEGEFAEAPKIFKETCRINWELSGSSIHNHVRGLSPYPAAWSTILDSNGHELVVKIFKTQNLSDSKEIASQDNSECGDIIVDGKRMFAVCGDGVVEILSLQPAGKRRMDASDFLLGYHPIKFISDND